MLLRPRKARIWGYFFRGAPPEVNLFRRPSQTCITPHKPRVYAHMISIWTQPSHGPGWRLTLKQHDSVWFWLLKIYLADGGNMNLYSFEKNGMLPDQPWPIQCHVLGWCAWCMVQKSCAQLIISCAQLIIWCAQLIIWCAWLIFSCTWLIILCARLIFWCAQLIIWCVWLIAQLTISGAQLTISCIRCII